MFAYRVFLALFISSALFAFPANSAPRLDLVQSERAPVSTCLAIAQDLNRAPTVTRANYTHIDRPNGTPKGNPAGYGPLIQSVNSESDTDLDRALPPFEARITFFDQSTKI
ncbi:unnamed protein product, partial [Laminaria digitata]